MNEFRIRLDMRDYLATALLISTVAVLTGCRPMTNSGIPRALDSEKLLQTAGSSQGITLRELRSEEAMDSNSVEIEHRFSATVASGTSGQLLAAYRKEVERTIADMGAGIHGQGISGTVDNVSDFSYSYTWGGNAGTVKVYSFTDTKGETQIVSLCYEHRR